MARLLAIAAACAALAGCVGVPPPPPLVPPGPQAGQPTVEPPAGPLRDQPVPDAVARRVAALLARLAADPAPGPAADAAAALGAYGADAAPLCARALPDAPPHARAALLRHLALAGRRGAEEEAAGALADPDWRVREAAALLLARTPAARARPALVSALDDAVGRVRDAAARALGGLADAEAARALAGAAAGRPGTSRAAALSALAAMPGPEAVAALVAAVHRGASDPRGEPAAWGVAVRALADRAPEGGSAAADALRAALPVAPPGARRAALLGCARHGALDTPEAAAAIRAELAAVASGAWIAEPDWPDPDVALAALGPRVGVVLRPVAAAADGAALHRLVGLAGRLPGPEATATLRDAAPRSDEAIRGLARRRDRSAVPILAALVREPGSRGREALGALGAIGGPEAVAVLRALLVDAAANLRRTAASALQQAAAREAAAPLAEAFARETDAETRAQVLDALRRADPAAAAGPARDALARDPDAGVRMRGALALREAPADLANARALAEAAVHDADSAVRAEALRAWEHVADPTARADAVARLGPALADEARGVRAAALALLAPLVEPAALAARTVLAAEPEEDLRAAAVAALGARAILGAPVAAALVVAARKDPKPEPRMAAAAALVVGAPPEVAGPAVRALLADVDPEVRLAAQVACAALGDAAAIAPALASLADASAAPATWADAGETLAILAPPGAAAAIRARLSHTVAPVEGEERTRLLEALTLLPDPGNVAFAAAESDRAVRSATGITSSLRGGTRQLRDAVAARAAHRLLCARIIAAVPGPEAEAVLRAAAAAPEQHRAVPALVALAARVARGGDLADALALAREATVLAPTDPDAWAERLRLADTAGAGEPLPVRGGPDRQAVADRLSALGAEDLAVALLPPTHGAGAPTGPPADDEATDDRSLDALLARADARLDAGDAAGARALAVEALVRGADPTGPPAKALDRLVHAAPDAATRDPLAVAWARARLLDRQTRLVSAETREFAQAAAAAARLGAPAPALADLAARLAAR